jgi:hypothetical protein
MSVRNKTKNKGCVLTYLKYMLFLQSVSLRSQRPRYYHLTQISKYETFCLEWLYKVGSSCVLNFFDIYMSKGTTLSYDVAHRTVRS